MIISVRSLGFSLESITIISIISVLYSYRDNRFILLIVFIIVLLLYFTCGSLP